ncbi:MAG: phage holin family protein [Firmicutes bacterium]|nr:phage holin family protein [Bacillota bacterium]
MDLSTMTGYYIPLVLIACMVVGYCIKHIPWLDKRLSDYIPTIMVLLGILLAVIHELSLGAALTFETFVCGAVTGLASTGLHQVFKNLIQNKK